MKILKTVFFIIAAAILVMGGSIFYAFKIEPYRLTAREFELNKKESSQEGGSLKVVQISDLHIKQDFTAKNLQKIVKKVNAQKPDIVVFTGDLYDNYARFKEDEAVAAELNKIQAKYDKIAIWGNRDYGGGAVRSYESVMINAGFTLLKNENRYITLENGKVILMTGLDDTLMGGPYMPDSTKHSSWDYSILLNHEPDSVDNYLEYAYDITLSGHSHGGQVKIPFLPFVNEKAVSATELADKYSRGMYELDESGQQKLYVSSGIGTTHISARFGVVPEVTVFQIYL